MSQRAFEQRRSDGVAVHLLEGLHKFGAHRDIAGRFDFACTSVSEQIANSPAPSSVA